MPGRPKRRAGAAAAIGGIALLAVAVARRRRHRSPVRHHDLALASSGRWARNAALASVGSKAGGTYALHRARRLFAAAERRGALDATYQLKTAEQVAETLGNLKGAVMKLGQMASYLDQGLPEPVRQALAELQQDAPPMSAELAAGVVRDELGRPPGKLFAEWDGVPIASASIGQVHRALTHDGRAVAVKVQYPGIAEAIKGDLDNAGVLFSAMGLMFPGLEPGPLVEELRSRVIEELDYRLEADNQRLFADYYCGHPFIRVPGVVDELSADRVLTTELAVGARFDEVLTWSQDERDRVGEIIYRFVFRSLYDLLAFNGDPHPGNYLFGQDGTVTFLDFGLVKRFQPGELAVFEDMVRAMVLDHDTKAFRKVIEGVGLLKAGQPFPDAQVEEYFGAFYDVVREHSRVTLDADYSSRLVRRIFDASGPYGEIMKAANVPPSFGIIQRINLGLYAVLGQLHATADWRSIADELWPFVNGPPSTELGRAEAAWIKSRSLADR